VLWHFAGPAAMFFASAAIALAALATMRATRR